MNNPRLELADGFFLSRITRGDKEAYLAHFADPEIAANLLFVPFPYTEADADWWLENCERNAREPEVRFGIRDAAGFLIGAIAIGGELPEGADRAEFGYWLAKGWRGRGIMPRAIRVFAGYAHRELGLRCLFATPFTSNPSSHRALEKAGFLRRGDLPAHHRKDGKDIDAVLYESYRPA